MKYLIPLLGISMSALLLSCGNSSTPLVTNNVTTSVTETAQTIAESSADSLSAMESKLDTDLVENTTEASTSNSTQTKRISRSEELENEKFRLAELERRRQLALLADPSLNIPEPKQVIAEEKAKFQKIVQQQTKKPTTKAPVAKADTQITEKPTPSDRKTVSTTSTTPNPNPTKTTPAATVTTPPKKDPTPPQTHTSSNTKAIAKINFEQNTFEFDTIVEGDVIDYKFKFVNTGTQTIEILNAKASCGCTRPSFPFLPIEPGQEGYIGVKYDSRTKEGNQTPQIEVVTNYQDEPIMLYLKGYVKDKSTAADSGK